MHVVAPGYWADLAGSKEASDGVDRKLFLEYDDVVVRTGKHVRATTVAREQQRALDRVERTLPQRSQRLSQVFVGGVRVTHLELHGSADRHEVADHQAMPVGVNAGEAAHQEVARTVLVGVLIHRDADLQTGRR